MTFNKAQADPPPPPKVRWRIICLFLGDIGYLSQLIGGRGVQFRYTPADYHYSWHTAPQRQFIVNLDGDEPVFFPFSIETSKCIGSCNNINYPYAKMCVPDAVKT